VIGALVVMFCSLCAVCVFVCDRVPVLRNKVEDQDENSIGGKRQKNSTSTNSGNDINDTMTLLLGALEAIICQCVVCVFV
jgi:hypothetical protein